MKTSLTSSLKVKSLQITMNKITVPIFLLGAFVLYSSSTYIEKSGYVNGTGLESNENSETSTPSDSEAFPTLVPFPLEPELDQGTVVRAQNIVYIPPNFNLSKIKGITGIKKDEGALVGRYVGRAACECGRPGERRLVGGEPAQINQYPWTAGLIRKNWLGVVDNAVFCAGSLINSQYVVTASHCVDGLRPRDLVVSLHEEDQNSMTETPSGVKRFNVEKIKMHELYQKQTVNNDIAVLKLSTPATLDNVIIPVCLPANNDYTFEGETATLLGWGATMEGGLISGILRRVDLPVLNNYQCNTETAYSGRITENMLCAGYIEEGGRDGCQGDSGGPLVIENGGRKTLIGTVSWGYGCAKPRNPGVYARVGRYIQWLLLNSQGGEFCRQ